MPQTVATRNNNPLNIKYGPATKKWVDGGAAEIGEESKDGGKFLKFKSPDLGLQAGRELLSSENYRDLDLDSAMKKWSNNGYGAEVHPGADPTSLISSLDEGQQNDLISSMAKREGYGETDKSSNNKLEQYQITDDETGDTFVFSSATPPSEADARKLLDQRKATKREGEIANRVDYKAHSGIINKIAEAVPDVAYDAYNLARKPAEAIAPKVMAPEDVEKLPFSYSSGGGGVLGSILDVATGKSRAGRVARSVYSGALEPDNVAVAAGSALIPGFAPFGAAYFGAKMAADVPEAAKELYEHPSFETAANAGLLGAGLLGAFHGIKAGFKGTTVPNIESPLIKSEPGTALENRPIDAEFVDNLPPTYEVRGPKQLTGKVGNKPAGNFGQPGPIITPPPEPSTSEGRRYYKGGPIVKNETAESIVDNLEKGPEAKKEGEVKTPLKNEWLRQQDPKVLETMKPGASPEVQAEIEQVIKEKQGVTKANEEINKNFKPNLPKIEEPPVERSIEEKRASLMSALANAKKFNDQTAIEKYTKKLEDLDNPKVTSPYEEQKPKLEEQLQDSLDEGDKEALEEGEVPESKMDEEKFKDYTDNLIRLEARTVSTISSDELKSIAKIGKEAGLDHETVIDDLVKRTSGVTNNVGKVWTAVNKVFMEENPISEMGSEAIIPKIDPRFVKVVGGGLNSRDLGRVAAQELVQNGLDAVRDLEENGKITVHFDSKTKTVTVEDNGTGMLPEVVKKEFLEPGGSKKTSKNPTGGFGIAKVPLFSNSELVSLETIAKDKNGKFIRSTTSFNGADWATFSKPITVNSEEVAPTQTGSKITLRLNPEIQAENYNTESYLKDFLKTHRLKTKFDFNLDDNKVETQEYTYHPTTYARIAVPEDKIVPIDTFKFDGGTATVSISEKTRETGYLPVKVLSNGMPQFVESFSIKEAKYPKQVIIDISPTSKAGDLNYPFRLDREGLREEANKAMHEWIKGTLVASAAFKELETYKGALKAAIPFGKGDFKIYNTDGSATPAIINSIARDIHISTIINNIGVVHKMMQDELAKVGKESKSDFKGLGLGKYLGVNVSGSLATGVSSNKNIVLVNPFNIYREVNQLVVDGYLREKDIPNMLASQIFATMLHELSHDEQRGHDVPMIGAFTRNVGFSGKVTNKLIDQLEGTITNDTIASISSFSNQLSSLKRGEDVFNKISVETPASISGGQGGNIKVNAPNEGGRSGQQKVIGPGDKNTSERMAIREPVESEFPLTETRPKEKGSFRPFAKSKAKAFQDGVEVKKEAKDFAININTLFVASGDAVRRFGKNSPAAQELSRLMQKERTVRNILIGRYQVKLMEAGLQTDRAGSPKNLSDEEVGIWRVKDQNGKVYNVIQGNAAGANEGKFIHYDKGKIVANKGFELVNPTSGNLIDVLEKNAAPMNPQVAATAKAINALQDKLGDLAERSGAGIRVGDTVVKFSKTPGGYFKRKYSEAFFDSLTDDPRNIETILSNIAKKEGITEGQAKAYINDSRKYGEIAFAPQHQMLTGYDSYIRDRSVFYDHIREFGNKIGTAAVVGPKDVNGPLIDGLVQQIKKDGGQVQFIRAILERNFNRDPIDPFVESANNFYHAVSSVMAARYLPFFAISDLATIGNIGMRGSLDKLLPAIIHNFKSQDLLKKSIMKTGALSEHITDSLAPEGLIQKIYLMKPVERFLRSTAAEVGRGTAKDLLKTLMTKKAGGKVSQYFYDVAYNRLKNLLLENDEGMKKLLEKGKLSEFQTDFAGGRMAEMTQGLVDPVDTPHFWNDKGHGLVGDFLMTYKRYSYQSTRMLFQAIKENPAKVIPMLLFVMPVIGELLGSAKAGLKGGLAGSVTGEGTLDGAIREIERRGEYLSRVSPFFKTHPIVARIVDDYLSSWAFGLISDGLMATLEGPSGIAEFFSGPFAAMLGEVGSSIRLIFFDELLKDTDFDWDRIENDFIKYAPGGEGAAIKRSEKEQEGDGGIVVRPPKLPSLP